RLTVPGREGHRVGQVDGSVRVPGRNPHVGGNLDRVPAVDVPERPPAAVELEVPVGEVGLDARLAEAGHPVNLPQQVERVPGSVGDQGIGQVLKLALLRLPEAITDDIGEGPGFASGGQLADARGGWGQLGESEKTDFLGGRPAWDPREKKLDPEVRAVVYIFI